MEFILRPNKWRRSGVQARERSGKGPYHDSKDRKMRLGEAEEKGGIVVSRSREITDDVGDFSASGLEEEFSLQSAFLSRGEQKWPEKNPYFGRPQRRNRNGDGTKVEEAHKKVRGEALFSRYSLSLSSFCWLFPSELLASACSEERTSRNQGDE